MRGTADDEAAPLPVREFHPTMSEMKDFDAFVARIEKDCAESGAALIHPPAEWSPRADITYSDIDTLELPRPIQQELLGLRGEYLAILIEKPRTTVSAFRLAAEKARLLSKPPVLRDAHNPRELDAIDRAFWSGALFRTPTYAADVDASLFDATCASFNLTNLGTALSAAGVASSRIPGVQRPYLYFGMWGALFAFHCEDADLYSINFLHTGSPKTWYTVPLSARRRFEDVCRRAFPAHFRSCDQFLRHKQALLSTRFLARSGVRFGRVTQTAGSFCIVFPGVYHAGFNHGFNVAEAVNFASERWIPMGSRARACQCQKDSATVDAEAVFRALFPERSSQDFYDFVKKDVYVDAAISPSVGAEEENASLSKCREQARSSEVATREARYWTRSVQRKMATTGERRA